jgi:hypothetical protein
MPQAMNNGGPTEVSEAIKPGDTYIADGDDYWTSGIDIGEHGNAVVCYARPESAAIALRDEVMAALLAARTPTDTAPSEVDPCPRIEIIAEAVRSSLPEACAAKDTINEYPIARAVDAALATLRTAAPDDGLREALPRIRFYLNEASFAASFSEPGQVEMRELRDIIDAALKATPAPVNDALAYLEAEARRFAGFYDEGSDGRNTFVMFADKIAALATVKQGDGE